MENESKPILPTKSSMEILSELFSTFHAEPPIIIKQEKVNEKKHKKKKKHKSKDKKHKRKSKKRKRSTSSSSNTSNGSSELDFDLANLLVKQEEQSDEKKIKIEGTDLSLSLAELKETTSVEDNVKTILKCRINSEEYKTEDGEVSDEQVKKLKKHKSKHRQRKGYSRERAQKVNVDVEDSSRYEIIIKQHDRNRSIEHHRSKDKDGDNFYKSKDKEDYKSDRKRSRSPHKSDLRVKEKHETRYHREGERYSRYNSFYDRADDFYKPRERDRSYNRDLKNDFYKPRSRSSERNREERWYNSKRSWDHSKDRKHRDRSPEKQSSHIDKKKLLEIARKNAIQMMKSGSLPGALTLGPQAQEKVIAAIKAGGKTIEELTDFCKTLSKKEDLGELSDIEEDKGSESDNDKPFNHPFQIKDRPTTITMNIKNSVPLPVKSTQERSTELRMQFPVSSGQHHRKNEHEWVTVEPKKEITSATKPSNMTTEQTVVVTPLVAPVYSAPLLSTISLPPSAPPLPVKEPQPTIDISAIVSQRLSAMRKLQENPHDVQALSQMYKSTKEVQSWAESKQQPGQFTGSVGGNFLSHSELSSGYQAWAKKDQLQVAAPVSGGMGMHLLQKMGWKPGEGLGKEKTGTLEPLLLEVKLDKRGLVANEETQRKRKLKPQQSNQKNLQGKHPVSLLGEYAVKHKLGAPTYELCFECGPDHRKNFLFKVILNGNEYKPNVASPNKKEAKANAATLCLEALGITS